MGSLKIDGFLAFSFWGCVSVSSAFLALANVYNYASWDSMLSFFIFFSASLFTDIYIVINKQHHTPFFSWWMVSSISGVSCLLLIVDKLNVAMFITSMMFSYCHCFGKIMYANNTTLQISSHTCLVCFCVFSILSFISMRFEAIRVGLVSLQSVCAIYMYTYHRGSSVPINLPCLETDMPVLSFCAVDNTQTTINNDNGSTFHFITKQSIFFTNTCSISILCVQCALPSILFCSGNLTLETLSICVTVLLFFHIFVLPYVESFLRVSLSNKRMYVILVSILAACIVFCIVIVFYSEALFSTLFCVYIFTLLPQNTFLCEAAKSLQSNTKQCAFAVVITSLVVWLICLFYKK